MERYQKKNLVGRGAYGTVFLCTRKSDNKLLILKEIPVDQMSVEERQASMIEAEVLNMLDHPNVVAYHESFLEDKTMIIVMEYVQGGTLFDYLNQRNGKLLNEEEVLHYFGQMVYTLQHVHRKLILHRDLKSQNILLNENKNVVKIGDFGISKVLSSKSKAVTVVGTPCYISPELCEGKPYNQKSDIWALGCILYELMTLKRPFDANTLPALIMKIMKGSFDPVPEMYSSGLRELLTGVLNLDPNQRPTAAQIMGHPVMISAIFKLYLEIGSIPCVGRSHDMNTSTNDNSKLKAHPTEEDTIRQKRNSSIANECPDIWIFDSKSSRKTLLPPSSKRDIKSISLGSDHIIGLTETGYLINWKEIPHIFLNKAENSDSNPLYYPSFLDEKVAVNITSVACGENFVVCLSDTGVVFSLGNVSSGCLGYSSKKDIQQPKIVEALFGCSIKSLSCGPKHVVAISEENEVYSWGFNEAGCLGLGEVECQILPQLVNITSNEVFERAVCGVDCSFIITDLSLMVSGSNRHNKLGLDLGEGKQIDRTGVFRKVCCVAISTAKIVSVSSGASHTLLLTETGEVFSMGSNRYGQLGWGNVNVDYSMPHQIEDLKDVGVVQVFCGDFFSLAFTNGNDLYCWGNCPAPLVDADDSGTSSIKISSFLGKKKIQSVDCYSNRCAIIGKEDRET